MNVSNTLKTELLNTNTNTIDYEALKSICNKTYKIDSYTKAIKRKYKFSNITETEFNTDGLDTYEVDKWLRGTYINKIDFDIDKEYLN